MIKKLSIFLIFCLTSVFAQDVELEAIGLSGGTFWSQNNWDPGIAVEANFHLGEVLDFVFMQPRLCYRTTKKSIIADGADKEINMQHISLGTKLLGFILPRPRGPYVGAAIDYHVITEDQRRLLQISKSSEIRTKDIRKVGLSALAGILHEFDTVSFMLETEYAVIPDGYNILKVTAGIFYQL